MEKTNDNGGLNRGEVKLNSESEHQNSLENAAGNSESQTGVNPTYDAENPELDAMLKDETTTKAEVKQAEQEEKAKAKALISDEDACNYALMGLGELQGALQHYTGKQIQFGQKSAMMFAALCAPVIQKYGRHLADFTSNEVDLDSWKPEMMAAGGLAVAAGAAWLSFRSAPDLPKEDDSDDGNKSK